MLMLDNFNLSDLLGLVSMGCWLGAQFPQVIENIRRQSCEGLALPFIANWLLGDISNLVGCLLTHQLPFQTWLATYFVAVDLLLFIQYFYYYKPPRAHPSIHSHLRSATLPGTARRMSIDRGASRYRTLSAVASNVAAAAALAAQHDEAQGDFPRTSLYAHRNSRPPRQLASGSLARDSEYIDDEEPPRGMLESFHSEGGRDFTTKRVSWSIERHGGRAASVGRPLALNLASPMLPISAGGAEPIYQEEPSTGLESSTDSLAPAITSARSARASRRGSGMVFLGVWALFGLGMLDTRRVRFPSSETSIGKVIWSPHFSSQHYHPQAVDTHVYPRDVDLPQPGAQEITFDDARVAYVDPEIPEPDKPSSTRILGRFFAWLCTTLYLTSRLPQIWKNYVRKSVEGLSMYLFVFAFLGNTFYVASILTSPNLSLPPPEALRFLKESVPYLLGSGGTLMFDITIVAQSYCYRPRQHRRHNSTVYARVTDEEEAGLLSGDTLAAHHSDITNRGRTSHAQTNTT